jgi:phosphoribosylanthranilate isomerase
MDRSDYYHVKFCGITRLEDAIEAIRIGVDMLGFNFYTRSPRFLPPAECARLIQGLKEEIGEIFKDIQLVGVFVNDDNQKIAHDMETCNLDLAQLSGNETVDDVRKLGGRAFKAIRGDGHQSLAQVGTPFLPSGRPPALLIDATSPGFFGGSGRLADWNEAAQLSRYAPILLAGGLTPVNVTRAIEVVRPWGVDVASGIERSPGVKDKAKMADFMQAVRNCQDVQL